MILVARRLLAATVDAALLLLMTVVAAAATLATGAEWGGWHVAGVVLLCVVYFSVSECLFQGRTLGRSWCGIRVVSLDQSSLTSAQTFSRAALFVLVPLSVNILNEFYREVAFGSKEVIEPWIVGFLLLPLSVCIGVHRGLHDLFAGTAVVREGAGAVPPGLEPQRIAGATFLIIVCLGVITNFYFFRFAQAPSPTTASRQFDLLSAPFRDLNRFENVRLRDSYRDLGEYYAGAWSLGIEPRDQPYEFDEWFLPADFDPEKVQPPRRAVMYDVYTNSQGSWASGFHSEIAKTLAQHVWRVVNSNDDTSVEVRFVHEQKLWPILIAIETDVIVLPRSRGSFQVNGRTSSLGIDPLVLDSGGKVSFAGFFEWPPGRFQPSDRMTDP